ncbi:MAG: hypothetical protein HY081_05320 [Gammaproteobacteria bacterium]|nr:hypothetical protein [Gammaproteobacteria bacterium]
MPAAKSDTGFYVTLTIIGTISLACLAMLFVLQPGLPIEPDIHARMRYILGHKNLWLASWFLWMLSALGLLLFCFYLLDFLPNSKIKFYALTLVAIGIGPDITAEFIFAVILPWLASNSIGADELTRTIHTEHFRSLEYLAVQLTGGFGNGAYNLGGIILNILGFKNKLLPRWLLWFGMPSWLLGLALSAATIIYQPFWILIFTASSMMLSLMWMLLVAAIIFYRPHRYRINPIGAQK